MNGRLDRLRAYIAEAVKEASVDNWDGYGAEPVTPENLEAALRFVELLPPYLPLPEVAVDPDGELSFDWQVSSDQIFSVSVGVETLAFAGTFHDEGLCGNEAFTDALPLPVVQGILKTYGLTVAQ